MAHDQTDHVRLISQKEDSRDAKTRLLDALDAALERCPWDAELAPLVAELRGAFGARAPLS